MYNKIFISYATEDIKYAEKLYEVLQQNDFSPWMDKKDLLPGQDWDFYIQQELRKADFIILLLSSISADKRGYVQKEFKKAANYCEEKLESDIYLIPVKLDACDVPSSLSKFQWVEYSSTDSMERILQSLKLQRSKMIKSLELKKAKAEGFETYEKELKGEYGDKNPKQTYELIFNLFKDEQCESLKELNIIVQKEILDTLLYVRSNYYKNLIISPYEGGFEDVDSTFYENISFTLLTKSFVSFTSFSSYYITGAAHGNYGTTGHNYFLDPLIPFSLEELFDDFENVLKILCRVVDEKLFELGKKNHEIESMSEFYLFEDSLSPKKENFDNYYFKNNALVFIYNPYQIACFAFGDHHPEISFDELIKLFPKEMKFISFIEKLKNNKN